MLFKQLSVLAISALVSATFISSVVAFPDEGDPDGTPPPAAGEGPEDGRWAPQTRWVIHPITGFPVRLNLILELPDKAFYEQYVKPKPPIRTVCQIDASLCEYDRPSD